MRVGAQLLLTFLLNASWQIALVVAFAAACDWLLRGTAARYRHGLWIAALALAFVLPLLGPARLVRTLLLRSKPLTVEAAAAPVFVTWTYSPDLDSVEPPASSSAPPAVEARRSFLASGIHLNARIATLLVALYGLFLLYRTGQLVRAWRRTKTIVQSAYECKFPAQVKTIVEKCQTAIGVRRVRILCSTSVPVPSTVGILNPLIILPEGLLRDVDEEVLTSAIGHELVHVARRDYLTNLIYEFIYLPLSFHPAAALLRRRIKQTRELCCDEAVASKLLRAETYARSLVRLIGAAPLARRLAVDTTIGISESDILEVRIMSLLKTPKLTARRKRLLLIMAALLLAAPCVAATSFALTFDIDRAEPSVAPQSSEKIAAEKLDRQAQQRVREELKRALDDLRKKALTAPESQRPELAARLREVQQNLELQERALERYQQTREEEQKKIEELRATLAELEKNRPANETRMKEAREKIAEMERLSTAEREREVQQVMGEMQKTRTDRKPRVIYRVEPEYTPDAREKKIEGAVVLTLTVDAQGLPQNVQVIRPLYPSLDQSAIEAARKMRFEPAMKDGQPVSKTLSIEMHFQMGPGDLQREIEDRAKREIEERAKAQLGLGLEMTRRKDLQDRGEERVRKQAELVRGATLSMDRAIQIATSQVPGKVLACSLGRDGDKTFYHVVIIGGDGDKSTTTYVWVSATDGQILKTEKEERREEETAMERGEGRSVSGGVLNGSATVLPQPVYPLIARQAKASGAVNVQIMIDEGGNVIDAHAVSGHPLLQAAAVKAARQATFKPTRLNGEPVRVTGTLVYNFVAQQ
ncbi:MAG TPA: TonB family protein [Pyrinomonadaceae bacterium]|nr:TonB family protein [Pyrinomonadaceae bacterium]